MKSSKILYRFIKISELLKETSEHIYEEMFKPYLQEPSHSFGFKPLSDIYGELVYFLDSVHDTHDFSYWFFEELGNIDEIIAEHFDASLYPKYKEFYDDMIDEIRCISIEFGISLSLRINKEGDKFLYIERLLKKIEEMV